MAKGPTTFAELREQEYTASIGTAVAGVAIIVVVLILLFVLNRVLFGSGKTLMQVGMGIGILAGVTIVVAAIVRSSRVNKVHILPFKCPYCDRDNKLVAKPTEDFDCEYCMRTIRFEGGQIVPVRTLACTNCGADHRISARAERFVCDKCNAIMQIQANQPEFATLRAPTATPSPRQGVLLGGANQNVLIQGFDPAREQKVAIVLQRELGVDLQEARRLLSTITDKTPLIVAYDVSQNDADALRRQLEPLGARIELRTTAGGAGR